MAAYKNAVGHLSGEELFLSQLMSLGKVTVTLGKDFYN